MTLPHVDAGCGGIDLYTGAFSYINSDELINTMKSIASSSSGYAFFLALETVSPQISNNIKYLQEMAMKANALNINSCETASQLVGAVWPKDTMASEHICKSMKSQKGQLADWVAGWHDCGNRGKRENIAEGKAEDSLYKNLLFEEYNIAWEALKKQSLFSENKVRAEIFMTLMGTIVKSRQESGEFKPEYLPAKALDRNFLKAMIAGGETTYYECVDKERCLVVKEVPLSVSEERSWIGQIRKTLLSIQNKILTESAPLTETEIEVIQKSRLPLFRILNAISAYTRANNPVEIYQVADIVTMDICLQYLREAIDVTRQGCEQLKLEQYFGHTCDEYLAHLNSVEKRVVEYEKMVSDKLEKELQLEQKIRMMEEELSEKLNVSW